MIKDEKNEITSLLNDPSIVIRPADKASGVVVEDAESFLLKLEQEIGNCDTYQRSDGNGQQEAERSVKKVANRLYKDHFCLELRNYLIPKHATLAKLKGNPKIHKEGNPMKTIVNGIGTATENMARVAEREIVENTPSYVRDTTYF